MVIYDGSGGRYHSDGRGNRMQKIDQMMRKVDYFLWIGKDAIYIWDRKKKFKEQILYLESNAEQFPYIPKFHSIWENIGYYKEGMGKILRKKFLNSCRILVSVPEDLSGIEKCALEDCIYMSAGGRINRSRGFWLCSHSLTLHTPAEDFIAVTGSCRSACIALVRKGEVEQRVFMGRNSFSGKNTGDYGINSRDLEQFKKKYGCESLSVYQPYMKGEMENYLDMAELVPFEEIAECLPGFKRA